MNQALDSGITINTTPPGTQFSTLIPVYNRERTIALAIESILAQYVPPFESIVVDDRSSDRTRSVLAGFGDRENLVSQRNGGVSAARNRCVREAKGEWLAFLDSDDYWLPGHLRRMSEAIEATNGGAALYFADMRRTDLIKNPFTHWEICGLKVPPPFHLKKDAADWAFMPCQLMMLQCSVIRRDKYLECGSLLEEMRTREDTLLFFKLCLAFPACAVSGCGAVLMDDGGDRLTQTLGEFTLEYCRATILLCDRLAKQAVFASTLQKKKIAQGLSSAHITMARANYRQRFFGNCLRSILLSGVANPKFCVCRCLDSLKSVAHRCGVGPRKRV